MKCQSCGAETKSAKYCEFCGSEMPQEKPNVNIVNNYYGNVNNQLDSDSCSCPKCNSRNFKYQREKVATVSNTQSKKSSMTNTRNSNSVKQTAYRTIGLCQNCGYTYYPNDSIATTATSKKHGFWWWLLVICFWPIPLSIWFYKTEKVKLEKKWKLAIITGFWVFMLIVSALSPDQEIQSNETGVSIESTTYVTDDNIISSYCL